VSTEIVRLTMPAKAEYLILARLALAGIARGRPMSESVLADLKLAVTEACGNAVRHAYPDDPGVVRVLFEVQADRIDVTVEDHGTGAVPGLPSAPELDGAPSESGMGLAIIHAVVDDVEIETSSDGAGTVVRMRKHLTI
jgi:serine/threonine-protein kinase RsbW